MAEEDIYSLCSMIAENSVVLIEFGILNYPVRDATDNKFIQCAIDGKVDYIITQDKDLLSLKNIGKIKILKPKEILDILSDCS